MINDNSLINTKESMVFFYFFSPNAALDIGFEKIFTATKKVCYGVVTHGCGLKDYFSLINLKHKKNLETIVSRFSI